MHDNGEVNQKARHRSPTWRVHASGLRRRSTGRGRRKVTLTETVASIYRAKISAKNIFYYCFQTTCS